jgi:predicted metal-dependent HD superfamily phosphohydrolase
MKNDSVLDNLITDFTGSNSDYAEFMLDVMERYGEDSRHYHNLDHIKSLYLLACDYKDLFDASEWQLLCGAIIFHDIIYHVKRSDNEEVSARYAHKWISKNRKIFGSDWKSISKNISRMILYMDPKNQNEFLINFFHDLDMMVLALEHTAYLEYVQQVKDEYVPSFTEEQFNTGRKAFVLGLIKQDRIFRTNMFYQTRDVVAIDNLTKELDLYK